MVLTKRLKLLSAAAAAIGIYIVLSRPDPGAAGVSTADPGARGALGAPAAGAAHAAPRASGQDNESLLARLAHRVTSSKTVGSLFHTQSWYVAPPAPPPAPVVEVAPPPPTAPPLPFTVMGSYARPGDTTVYFLTRGDRVFDVHVGDTIDNTYSVDSAANGLLQLTYKPLNIQQTLPLGESQ
ncbi:MAG TPA: hypothetical protein VK130_02405 [Steroidobacteraceae bacterium]|nr:hypothetical protein [Steroidobacteraceae bacterium]